MGWDDANSWMCKQPGCGGTAGDDGFCHAHPSKKRPNTSLGNELPKDLLGPYRRNRYLTKSNPEHPCHRGCSHIWNSHEQVWRCYRCGDPDTARPAPTSVRPAPLQLPPLPISIEPWTPVTPTPSVKPYEEPKHWTLPPDFPRPQVTFKSPCCMCTDPANAGKPLGLVCHCSCHPQITC